MSSPLTFGDDLVQPFQLESGFLRGRLVRLGPTLDLILHQHAYPTPVAHLLAETMVIAAALGTALKYDGVFTFQAKSDGAVGLLVADVTSDGGIRAYAQHRLIEANDSERTLLGKGVLAFTVDQKRKEDRYQGIVELEGDSLAAAVQHYFRQSEQIPTGIIAAVQQDANGRWNGGCLMLQQMPREGGITEDHSDTSVEDDWHRAMLLMGTCKAEELALSAVPPQELLYRLFHEDGVRVFESQRFRHQCRCSKARVESMLKSLPRAEIETMTINGVVDVTCEFCNMSYVFDQGARDQLYRDQIIPKAD